MTEDVLEERRLLDSAVLFSFVEFLRKIWYEENTLLDRVFGRSRRESLLWNLNLLTLLFSNDSSEHKADSTESGLWESTAQKSEKEDEDDKKTIEDLDLEKYKEEQEAFENVEVEDDDPYQDRVFDYKKDTGLPEAIQTGKGQLNAIPFFFGAMEFWFMGGSMGSVVGERIARLVESASNRVLPMILVCASGGARMQEGSYKL
uniref:Acetyl-CoA carboxylase carboxyltransferase beta subunit n=1 Tax=Pelargonium myrrhifolium TaxID=253081 RepID=A0A1B0PSW1_9ROSI|nr:acetyl-CoA carboxylase carboxyltransferase beta subunit [Pelargonium myrrhifolium]AJB99517.1 acetyl-CoA carboxylase carboxyltransferase beta subunit [Pelargonium myrrhifolium]